MLIISFLFEKETDCWKKVCLLSKPVCRSFCMAIKKPVPHGQVFYCFF